MNDAQRIHQLEQQLVQCDRMSPVDHTKQTDLLNDLAWALSDVDLQRAYALAETAHVLASSPDDGAPPYEAGMAYSLRTQGYVNMRLGDYPLGMSQLLQALALVEALELEDGLPDVLDGLIGVYGQIGSFPEALNTTYRQLEAAQRNGDKRRIANAYNNLAHIYTETGLYQRAVEALHQNLQIGAETDYARIECLSNLNLAETYLLIGDYGLAREHGEIGLGNSQKAGFQLFEVYSWEILGKIAAQSGDQLQAVDYLQRALASSRTLGSKVTESLILLDLGRAYNDMQRHDLALDSLHQGLAVAQSIDAKNELFKIHLLLSEVYEQMGAATQALAHFKQYQALKELVAGEKADQRLKVLQVAHDTEAAKKEAEIAALRTIELQQQVEERTAELRDTVDLLRAEIEERERAERALQEMAASLERHLVARTEELAAFFDLTLLAGQGVNLPEVFEQVLPRILEATRSRAICVHLLDAGRTTLHLAGQQSLASDAQTQLQIVELSPDLQRWLQKPNDPLITTALSGLSRLPAALRVPGFQTYLGTQIRIGQRTEGLLSCFRFTDRGFSVDDIALVTALAEQIGMMVETDRLRHDARAMAVLEERQRLARDLHDSVTQSLYSLTLFSRAGREAAEDGDSTRLMASLTELERNTLHALREMRLLLYELRPADLEQEGLSQAIQLRLNTVERRSGLQLDVELDDFTGISPTLEVQVYHIVVEALNNVVKHAAATRLAVRLTRTDGRLHLRIADDGRGFDPSQRNGGMGLDNMAERVARLGGQLSVVSKPGGGTRLEATIPYQAEVA